MNKLPREKRVQIIGQLVEGMSLRAITRTTGVSLNTVTSLLVTVGRAAADYHDRHVRNVKAKRVQCDELWAFCYAKQKNVKSAKAAPYGAGDIWTRMALDADHKLVISYLVGGRDASTALVFMKDVGERLANRVQMTTDGHKAYLDAIDDVFGSEIDYAMLVKIYGHPEGAIGRYSPGECIGAEKKRVEGRPDPAHISTSYAERSNLTVRMHTRRLTRLTNAFSKKAENHAHAIALHCMAYNFVRIHGSLRCSPAMAAGVAKKLWEVSDLVQMVEDWEAAQLPAAA
jgi:IS1 family transposase